MEKSKNKNRNIKRKAKWRSENQKVKNKNGKVKNKNEITMLSHGLHSTFPLLLLPLSTPATNSNFFRELMK